MMQKKGILFIVRFLLLSAICMSITLSSQATARDFGYRVSFADINDDGLDEIRLTPRFRQGQTTFFGGKGGSLQVPVSISNELQPLLLERYCVERVDLDPPPDPEPCLNICASSVGSRPLPDVSGHGVEWDYAQCPVDEYSNWRIAAPRSEEELDAYRWSTTEAEYELLSGNFRGDGHRGLVLRALNPTSASIYISYARQVDEHSGRHQIEKSCKRLSARTSRSTKLMCTHYCASDGSDCLGDEIDAYYTVNNTGSWFGDKGIDIRIIDVNSDGVDDIRVFRDGYKLNDVIHAASPPGPASGNSVGLDTDLVRIKWDGFVDALQSGDPDKVVNYTTSDFREKYKELLEQDFTEISQGWS
ncbi:MAG: hypothetical protein ACR2QG_04405, partial [Gammaproteobacteria bacterium]